MPPPLDRFSKLTCSTVHRVVVPKTWRGGYCCLIESFPTWCRLIHASSSVCLGVDYRWMHKISHPLDRFYKARLLHDEEDAEVKRSVRFRKALDETVPTPTFSAQGHCFFCRDISRYRASNIVQVWYFTSCA
ncbi:unnamed protein product [Ectocarpus sp. 13 AM-2016]